MEGGINNMENDLVRYSRAGDVFHYRWAARRCLRLIYPKTSLRYITVEGSREEKMAGEYVIDIAEYSDSEADDAQEIAYFQLKHTTVRKDQAFNISDLKDTISGFAERYIELFCKDNGSTDTIKVTFTIVTNRPIAESFKQNIVTVGAGGTVNNRFQGTLENYSGLKDRYLSEFCTLLKFIDGEGDYIAQRHELHVEISQLLAGTVDTPQIDSITTLIQEKALPDSNGRIVREDILKRFGVTTERDLYPAPPELEKMGEVIQRNQHNEILDSILNSSTPVIIHAAGGVGKSIFARQLIQSLPIGSFGILYDCFGGGRYRNRSEQRHRHRDALIQIVNELSSQGLCDPLIIQSSTLEDEILRKFFKRIKMAVESLRKADENAILAILIDAADNAEMAAKEFNQPCFVHELLRELMPDGCQLVALCRTERIHLLQPSSIVLQLELKPFSLEETQVYLRKRFPKATDEDGLEFYRLTNNGNPRVQANALHTGYGTITETLASLGPSGSTVEEQIGLQLDYAIQSIKEKFPYDYQSHIDAICVGLATLPPFIPTNVLAEVANVDEATIKSFITDMGRPLWLTDSSVQFRDEPTETWFRENFSASAEQKASYVLRLKPLANNYTYVSETLPSLLLQAEKYDELIELALSDDLLPKDNLIDERNVRVYRLQFAFKAALKLKRYADSIKLALRAGEEVAGDNRQYALLTKNIDLVAYLQSKQRVQELAFRRMFRSAWDGSENVYSSSLLSFVEDFKGEARGYFRAATNWLNLYFEERKKWKDRVYHERLNNDDIVELTFAHFNLFGISKTVDYILSWRPPQVVYDITQKFIRRLIDAGNFDAISEISLIDKRSVNIQYFMVALAQELLEVGRFPDAASMELCLDLLILNHARIIKPDYIYNDSTLSAIISFTEACTAKGLPKGKILRVIRHYIPKRTSHSVVSNFREEYRGIYLRALSLKSVLTDNFNQNIDELLPKDYVGKEKDYKNEQDIREFREVIGGLLPWYIVRAHILNNNDTDILKLINDADQKSKNARGQRWKEHDIIPYEISRIIIEILTLCNSVDPTNIGGLYTRYLDDNTYIWIQDRIRVVRNAFRIENLSKIRNQLEQSANDIISSSSDEGPETKAELYTGLARAVLSANHADAAAYFEYAIEAVSKFGDEIVERWQAVIALARRNAEGEYASPERAYRFIRCAELIGDNVAREKYFNRNEAIRIATKLSPISALASLSRWHDRNIGDFDEQLPALAEEIVSSNVLTGSVGWSLSAFLKDYRLDEYASLCIEKEPSVENQQYILDTAVRDLRFNDAGSQTWQKLKQISSKFSLRNAELDDILSYIANNNEGKGQIGLQKEVPINYYEVTEMASLSSVFHGLDLASSSGISQAKKRFEADLEITRSHNVFWQELISRIGESDALKFLQALADVECIDIYDIKTALSLVPEQWFQRVSVRRNWIKIVEVIAQRFASELVEHFTLKYFMKDIRIENEEMLAMQKGILEGLANKSDLINASTFFGFVEIEAPLISLKEATDLLDFALGRFEIHIDTEYADGCWAEWLLLPGDISIGYAGLVWAALGSPRSETRWQAVHCIRRLAEANCEKEIDALFIWMEKDGVGAFGSHRFPFYNLHARLYLLIALARISYDNPKVLLNYSSVFHKYALEDMQHVLIQKFSAETALNIEKAYPNTYRIDVLEQLRQVGVSLIPVKELSSYNEKFSSYWHVHGGVDTSLKFHHGYDFYSYWFRPLGEVFGIPGKQVEELATEVIVNEWNIKTDGSYRSDPRSRIWKSNQHGRETWNSHGSYPRTYNYNFYLSYHAMFVVAAKLLEKMPVIRKRDWYEDEWLEWLHRHMLTRKDGRWLADRRDPAPLQEPDWIHQNKTDSWRSEIIANEFLKTILFKRKGEVWLNVFGAWEEGDIERSESLYVSTALVSPTASQSLLNALATCSDPRDFKLPDYQEDNMEFDLHPFVLKGWVLRNVLSKHLDEFDPFAGDINYPPYEVGQVVMDKLGLLVDSEQREWFWPNKEKASMLCEIWSINKCQQDEEPNRHGNRLSATLAFLVNLCKVFESELIFEVQINRRFKKNYYTGSDDENGYTPPKNRIYILSADGKLRDTETYYQLG
jgi:hypothetical protein